MVGIVRKRYLRKLILIGSDMLFVCLTLPLALSLRLDTDAFLETTSALNAANWLVIFFSYLLSFVLFRTYRTIVRLANLFTALRVSAAVLLGATFSFIIANYSAISPVLPRSTYPIQMLLVAPLCLTSRFAIRIFSRYTNRKTKGIPTLVYGAGLTTDRFLPYLLQHQRDAIKIIGIIDDDPAKIGSEVQGVRVKGNRRDIPQIVTKYGVKQVVLAMPSISGEHLRKIIDSLYKLDLKVKILPAVEDYVNGIVSNRIAPRDINIEDLLRRPSRKINKKAVQEIICGKTVLITGGGGSIGAEIVRQVVSLEPTCIIVNDASEHALYQITEEIQNKYSKIRMIACLGSMADESICKKLFTNWKIDVVFHACAYKHVPLVETNVVSAIFNNIESAKNVFEYASKTGTERVVLISSDKAVRPTNVMGATKRVCELLALWYANSFKNNSNCLITAVRFGNVLGSSGSVVPKFVEQIRAGGPVTVTHPEITRYFMLIPEAVSLVLQAAATAEKTGEIFVLNMGKPIKISDMAKDIIRLMCNGNEDDIPIKYTGLRPGEKLYEELHLDDESLESISDDFFKLTQAALPGKSFARALKELFVAVLENDECTARERLFGIVRYFENITNSGEMTLTQSTTKGHDILRQPQMES